MEDERPDPVITQILRDIYRLGLRDESAATSMFQDLLRSGYSNAVHRSVVTALQTHTRKTTRQ